MIKDTKVKVSIIMSTYNTQQFIERSINSILNQSFKNWELILINDASTDNTQEIINNYMPNSRILIKKNLKNQGIPKCLNTGIKFANGDLIAILDADDEWIDNDKLKKQVEFLKNHSDYGLVGTYAHAVNGRGKKIFDIKYPLRDDAIRKVMFHHNCFLHSTILYRKNVIGKVGNYDENSIAQDYDLCLKIGSVSKISNLPSFTTNYTVHSGGTSQLRYWRQTSDTIRVIRKYKNLYPGYYFALFRWSLRKLYPLWLRILLFKNTKKYE